MVTTNCAFMTITLNDNNMHYKNSAKNKKGVLMVTVSALDLLSLVVSLFALGYSLGTYFALRSVYGR